MVKNKLSIILFLFFLFLVFYIYIPWFLTTDIIGGDWPFFYQNAINTFSFLPPSWSGIHGNGFGGPVITYALDSYLYATGWFFSHLLHIPWSVVYKFFWFAMFIFVSFFTSMYLSRIAFKKSVLWQQLLAVLVYSSNTYILLVASGGQMGVALGYAFAPLVLARFIVLRESLSEKEKRLILSKSILAGIIFAVQILFDFRIAYLTMGSIVLYVLLSVFVRNELRKLLQILLYIFILPIGSSILLHLFWILPLLIFHQNPAASLNETYTSVASLQFFSFAALPNTISLLHPSWPENIFGKVDFMKPEYLLLPLIAFASLLFVSNKKVLFFALLGLVGAFLAKGAQEPFGQIFIWAYSHVPGFVMFRDPTKFYLFIAISYSVLIPFTLMSFCEWFNSKFKGQKYTHYFLLLLFVLFWLFSIRQAVFGQLSLTFQSSQVPQEYVQLKDALVNDTSFSRTLWMPRQSRFAFVTNTHPSIEAGPQFKASNAAEMLQYLQDKKTQFLFNRYGIKYVIVPYDNLGEIFIKDRKYDAGQFEAYKKDLQKITWLKKDNSFHKLVVYTTQHNKNLLSLEQQGKITYTSKNSDQYQLAITSPTENTLIFSDEYHSDWQLQINKILIKPQRTADGLMQFKIRKGQYHADLVFVQKYWYTAGFIISFVALIALLAIYFMLQYRDFFIYLKNTF